MKNKYFTTFIVLLILFFSISTSFADDLPSSMHINMGEDGLIRLTREDSNQGSKAWAVIILRYRKFIVGVAGLGAVTMVALFIKHFVVLGTVAGNPQAREEALKGLLYTGLATALLGSVSIIMSLFYNVFK